MSKLTHSTDYGMAEIERQRFAREYGEFLPPADVFDRLQNGELTPDEAADALRANRLRLPWWERAIEALLSK